MARFDNKVVLVSGDARGQGAAEARLLVAQGAKVVIGDVLDNQGQALAAKREGKDFVYVKSAPASIDNHQCKSARRLMRS